MSAVESVIAKAADKLDQSPKVITGWRDAWKMHSVQASAVGVVFTCFSAAAAQSLAATVLVGVLPITIVLLVAAAIFSASMVGRLLVQPKLAGKIDASDSAGV